MKTHEFSGIIREPIYFKIKNLKIMRSNGYLISPAKHIGNRRANWRSLRIPRHPGNRDGSAIWYPEGPQTEQKNNSYQAPVPLSIFRSNSKFDENRERSSFEYTRPITTILCTRHDSDTVVTCAKYRCDRPRIFYTRVFWIFIEFRIRSKYA